MYIHVCILIQALQFYLLSIDVCIMYFDGLKQVLISRKQSYPHNVIERATTDTLMIFSNSLVMIRLLDIHCKKNEDGITFNPSWCFPCLPLCPRA